MEETEPQLPNICNKLINTHNYYVDKTTLYIKTRWFTLLGLFITYILRVYYVTGFYVVSYALAIFLLNLFLRFLTPHNIEEIYEQYENENNGLLLPMKQTHETKNPNNPDDKKEFRPFLRKLNEFKFWLYSTRAICISIFCTFFSFLDIPVFWPLLLFYFICLFFATMKQQIKNMIRFKYLPFNTSTKQTYGSVVRGTKNGK
ncbi:retrieval receptor for endoplasmic reticulum membrane proteins, putative [Plasmodium reichenowi]|uniref:Protein RER1 n=1 Tax=Plasmodium reichenowi TaxID=5854 RepID=A0A060RRV0_PLARE|nr:putative retrieval receptor for endoplasmic reticulum membrane proteins [Plasmodium reichenowi]KYN98316.1 putative retrieval receptor for endoplasmic reticulum membrane proteins [Plasmodium reichenowi]CDO64091.1 retrieval receptor for endoplasmic reticulum membrane proteins, putative [Plasmodium reichenowi]